CSSTAHHLCIDIQVADPDLRNDSTIGIDIRENEHEILTSSDLSQQRGRVCAIGLVMLRCVNALKSKLQYHALYLRLEGISIHDCNERAVEDALVSRLRWMLIVVLRLLLNGLRSLRMAMT